MQLEKYTTERRQCLAGGRYRQLATCYWLPLLVTIVLFAALPRAMAGQQANDLDATIQYLITYVEESGVIFIRNSKRYQGREAAQHIDRKYRHFKDDIDTPEKFIELSATGSLMTGKPYMIITKQGEQLPSGKWLNAVLQDYRLRNQSAGN